MTITDTKYAYSVVRVRGHLGNKYVIHINGDWAWVTDDPDDPAAWRALVHKKNLRFVRSRQRNS